MALPDIPRLYTALAEWLAVMVYARSLPRRGSRRAQWIGSAAFGLGLGVFLQMTGDVPLAWWVPCMAAAVVLLYLFLGCLCDVSGLDAAYHCARAFTLAEFAASAEWQLHCALFPQRRGGDWLAVLLLGAVYGAVYGLVAWLEQTRPRPTGQLEIRYRAALVAVIMAMTVFAVSNLSFLQQPSANMSVFYIRTLVDFSGVLILALQHDQLREQALHSELAAMDSVLHRQYEQYQRSKEGINLINRRYHELKIQLARIREEQDQAKQNAAIAAIEQNIRQYEAENKTGNPVLDTLLTAKSMYCQQHSIRLTCVADGRLLNFLSTREICTLVGTALDNACESMRMEPDPDKRLIRLALYAQNGFVMLRVENYCAAPVELGPDGLPARSSHGGYDLKSVRAAAQRYGGTLTLHWENNWFTLRVLLPIPPD